MQDRGTEAKCRYTVNDRPCPNDVALHVILPGRLQFFSCKDHGSMAAGQPCEQIHPYGEFCGNTRSMWFPEAETCKIPANDAELVIGIFLFS